MLKVINWLISLLFGKKKEVVNPDYLKGQVAEIKKANVEIQKQVEEKKAQKNSGSEIEDYFNK